MLFRKEKKSMTLIELIAVVVIVSMIAAFAIPNFMNQIEQTYEREAIQQLRAVYLAQQLYRGNTATFYPDPGQNITDLDTINDALHLSIMANGFNYSCANTANPICQAQRIAGGYSIIIRNDLALSDTNPYCSTGGTCPTLN